MFSQENQVCITTYIHTYIPIYIYTYIYLLYKHKCYIEFLATEKNRI